MKIRRYTARAGLAGATSLLVVAGFAGAAHATSADIDSWTSRPGCDTSSVNWFCLYFSPNHTGGVWRSSKDRVPTINGTFSGGAGDGQAVRNNAASADNGTANCHVGIWVKPDYMGDSNFLIQGDKGGNLTASSPRLRNNEASIAVDDVTNCPGIGLDR